MVNYDAEDKVDEKDAQSKTSNLKVEFDRADVKFWFQQLEMHLSTAGVNAQWTKRLLLHKQLPKDVIAEVKDLLRKDKSEAGATPYKDLKTRIMETFGKKTEDAYAEAKNYMLVGKPSQLLNKIINTICEQHPTLENCCSAGVIYGMWKEKLPPEVRQNVAGMPFVGRLALDALMRKADSVYDNLAAARPVAAVYSADLDTSADEPALQVAAATSAGRGRWRKPGGQSQPPDRSAIKPHPDGPPQGACNTHFKYGRAAFKCRKPDSCPWAHLAPTQPRPKPAAK